MSITEYIKNCSRSFFEKQNEVRKVGFLRFLPDRLRFFSTESKKNKVELRKPHSLTLDMVLWISIVFWAILLLDLKPYGVLSLVGLVLFFYDMCCPGMLNEKYKDNVCCVKDMENAILKLVTWLESLRHNSPSMFTSLMTITFLLLRVISTKTSGSTIGFLVLFVTLFVTNIFQKHAPEDVLVKIKKFLQPGNIGNTPSSDMEPISLIAGIDPMPSYLEVAESCSELKEEDLLPNPIPKRNDRSPGDSSDSDSEKRVFFESDHFNTSSSEEEVYLKGLNRSGDNKKEGKNVFSLSDSDSDFEIIDSRDVH